MACPCKLGIEVALLVRRRPFVTLLIQGTTYLTVLGRRYLYLLPPSSSLSLFVRYGKVPLPVYLHGYIYLLNIHTLFTYQYVSGVVPSGGAVRTKPCGRPLDLHLPRVHSI